MAVVVVVEVVAAVAAAAVVPGLRKDVQMGVLGVEVVGVLGE